ncbi:MAG TPA: hypothetical protein VGC14_27705 [Rhizobium sp.]
MDLLLKLVKGRLWSIYERREPAPIRDLRDAISDVVTIVVLVVFAGMIAAALIFHL